MMRRFTSSTLPVSCTKFDIMVRVKQWYLGQADTWQKYLDTDAAACLVLPLAC